MSVIHDWDADKASAFGRETLEFDHGLHERPMFDDAGLEQLLDQYPREQLGVFTMGADPVDWRSWRRGEAGALSGGQLLDAAQSGRIWLNLRHTNDHLPAYAALEREIFADKEAHVPGLKTFKRDLGMLISSANAQVFYHLDVPLVSLWQLRGEKQVFVYPVGEPFVPQTKLEAIVLREQAEQFAYEPGWDHSAQSTLLRPGRMVTWKQNAPHRIVNGPMLNVSLSIEFMTPAAMMRANILYANGVLRRRAGLAPRVPAPWSAQGLGKAALARGFKAMKLQKAHERVLPVSFDLRQGVPARL